MSPQDSSAGDKYSGMPLAKEQQEPALPSDGKASAVPQLSCPGLISRSQSAASSDAGNVSISEGERPTLLGAAKALRLKQK